MVINGPLLAGGSWYDSSDVPEGVLRKSVGVLRIYCRVRGVLGLRSGCYTAWLR
jgi:hypothetical protein